VWITRQHPADVRASPSSAFARPCRDPRRRPFPPRVERMPRAVEVDRQGSVVRRDRLALAGLAIDLGPHSLLARLVKQQWAIPAAPLPEQWRILRRDVIGPQSANNYVKRRRIRVRQQVDLAD